MARDIEFSKKRFSTNTLSDPPMTLKLPLRDLSHQSTYQNHNRLLQNKLTLTHQPT
jgi:hypothetical protein